MQYDLKTARANNTDVQRDDRWEVVATADNGTEWVISDSSQMTEADAEGLAADLRAVMAE